MKRRIGYALAIAGIGLVVLAAMLLPAHVPSEVAVPGVSLLAGAALLAALGLWLARGGGSRRQPDAARAPVETAEAATVSRQITALRRTQNELLAARREADAALMAKGEFLATMSHEIRTPLNGILPLLELVLSTSLDDDQRDYIATAHASASELLRIVDDILDYSKLDADRIELETIGINLRELVDSVRRLMQRSADAKGLQLLASIDPGVRLAVRGDPVRLRQVLTNLVSNAIKFTEHGSVAIRVSRRGETATRHELVFSVRDTGIGIAPDVQQRLFRPFTQADASTTRMFGGTGLGLAICKRLVELMGGRIDVRSEPGRGSMFWFAVPLAKALGDLDRRRELNGLRVLLLSNDTAWSDPMMARLALLGLDVTASQVPADALTLLRGRARAGSRARHELVLIDTLAFPSAGPALARTLGGDLALRDTPIVLLVDNARAATDVDSSERVHALARGAGDPDWRRLLDAIFQTGPVQRPAVAPPPAPAAPTAPARTSRPKALLAEDHPVNRRVAERLLALAGVDVISAEDGRQALEILERGGIDIVFMDARMPVMDGYAATRAWRERERNDPSRDRVPIIALTANVMAGDREKCLIAGMDDYLPKPLSRERLGEALTRWLASTPHGGGPAARAKPDGRTEGGMETPSIVPIGSSGPGDQGSTVVAAEGLSPSIDGPAIDPGTVSELLEVMGREFADLVRVYLEDSPGRVRSLGESARSGDRAELISAAHALKSGSANVGARRLAALAADAERAAREERMDDARTCADRIAGEYDRAASELERILAGPNP